MNVLPTKDYSNIETVKDWQEFLGFEVPSVVWAKLVDKFESELAEFIGFDLTTCLNQITDI